MILTRFVPGLVAGLALVAWTAGVACARPEPAAPGGQVHRELEEAARESISAMEGKHEGGHGAHGPVNTNPLEFKRDLALWTFVVFLLLLLILRKFAWGPIARGLQRREDGIADQIAQAERANQQAKELLGQYEQRLAGAQEEVHQFLEKAQRDAEHTGHELIEKAQAEAKHEQQRALQQIDAATADALKELADLSATLAVDLAGKIVRAELKPDDHARLIQQAVSGFARRPPSTN
ncbi:MAG: F0F1 ATP synthase subunit B [Pirellulales bacterium]|nr:F0F1 ATP synthase subunit B [Pirellulales bacterium]